MNHLSDSFVFYLKMRLPLEHFPWDVLQHEALVMNGGQRSGQKNEKESVKEYVIAKLFFSEFHHYLTMIREEVMLFSLIRK